MMNNGNKPERARESTEEFCQRLGIKHNTRQGGIEWGWNGPPYQGSQSYVSEPEDSEPEAESEIPCSDEQDQFDALPEEFKEHLWAVFIHKAGYGPDPGKYSGPAVDPDEIPL